MSQSNSNEKAAMLAKLAEINKVEGFDPTPFAVEYTDLITGEVRKRLPVMIQIALFRMKYPEGRIAIQVSSGKDCFVATARVYPSYKTRRNAFLRSDSLPGATMLPRPSRLSPRMGADGRCGHRPAERRLRPAVQRRRGRF